MADDAGIQQVSVIYALAEHQHEIFLQYQAGETIGELIDRSEICQQFPAIDLTQNSVGVFNQIGTLETLISAGDRVEIYRPLKIDPKEARRKRAKQT